MHKTYILIDTLLLGDLEQRPWAVRGRNQAWIIPIYGRNAVEISPVLIDVEQAIRLLKMDKVMQLVNSKKPQLGISVIDTNLTFQAIVTHLRNFIYIRTEDDTELTLRFADCAVLPSLASIFTPMQWKSLTDPFKRWGIHNRNGNFLSLPCCTGDDLASLPLFLCNAQVAALKNSVATDQLLFNLKMQRPAPPGTYDGSKAYNYAGECIKFWSATGNSNNADLVFFAAIVFDTEGKLLEISDLSDALKESESKNIHASLKRISAGLK